MLRLALIVVGLALVSGDLAAQDGPATRRGAGTGKRGAEAPIVLQGAPAAAAPTTAAPVPDVEEEPPAAAADDSTPVIPNYLRRSGSRAGGPANDLNPSGRPEGSPLPGGSIEGAVTGRELYHGNYCGYGNRGEGLPPTDALDEACMHHDACYDRAGHRSCACDKILEREAARVANSPRYSRELRARAGIVVQAGNVMECESP